jgi:hypothetical protein
MKRDDRNPSLAVCANPGCGTPAGAESEYCESCELERMLYRRDLRETATPAPRPPATLRS